MADERRPRPVSGEIMTDAESAASMRGAHLGGDIVDAEYETVLADDGSLKAPFSQHPR